jgi:pimeloyl-ACP methyl ester carboxylesterase
MTGQAAGQERDLRIAGLRLRVREAGEGPPLLLINGIGANTAMLRPLEQALPDRRVISFDAPGAGHSQVPHRALSMRALAGVVETLLDRLGHDRVDVLGYSFGGAVAQQLARQAPQRVRRLVLVATTPGWGGVPGKGSAMVHMLTPMRYWSKTYYEATVAIVAGGQAHDRDFVRRHGGARRAKPPSMLGYLGQMMTLTSWSSVPWLADVPHPTLVVFGDDDPLTPVANGVLLAARLPKARLHVLPGEGHLLLLDERSAAPGLVRDFLTAERLSDSRAWRTGRRPGAPDEAEAVAGSAATVQPWGMLSRAFRSLVS